MNVVEKLLTEPRYEIWQRRIHATMALQTWFMHVQDTSNHECAKCTLAFMNCSSSAGFWRKEGTETENYNKNLTRIWSAHRVMLWTNKESNDHERMLILQEVWYMYNVVSFHGHGALDFFPPPKWRHFALWGCGPALILKLRLREKGRKLAVGSRSQQFCTCTLHSRRYLRWRFRSLCSQPNG